MNRKERNSENTKKAILDSAENVFVKSGFDGASISKIASGAKCTTALIFHHFGTKRRLWDEVRKRLNLHYLRAQQQNLNASGKKLQMKKLEQTIEERFNFLRKNPNEARLHMWMLAQRDRSSPEIRIAIRTAGIKALQEGQDLGLFRKDVEVRNVLIMFVCLIEHWFATRHLFDELPGEKKTLAEADEEYLRDMIKVFTRGVAADPLE